MSKPSELAKQMARRWLQSDDRAYNSIGRPYKYDLDSLAISIQAAIDEAVRQEREACGWHGSFVHAARRRSSHEHR
jgi:hypothetical protein